MQAQKTIPLHSLACAGGLFTLSHVYDSIEKADDPRYFVSNVAASLPQLT